MRQRRVRVFPVKQLVPLPKDQTPLIPLVAVRWQQSGRRQRGLKRGGGNLGRVLHPL